MSKKNNYSAHHILPRSMWGNNDKLNIVNLKDRYHQAIHTVFENKMIAEQLLTTVSISEKALREDVRRRLIDVLSSKDMNDPFEWYNPKVIRWFGG